MERTELSTDVLSVFEQGVYVREIPQNRKTVKRRIGFFTGEERHQITLEEGMKYTRNYRKSSKRFGVSGAYFGREIVEKILDQERCVGIRIYYARLSNGKPTLVLSGAETNNADQYRGVLGSVNQSLQSWIPCPNQLNSDSWRKFAPSRKATKIFDGRENHYVTLAEAAQLIRNYQKTIEFGEIKGHFFGSGIFRKILAQEGCVGIHMYHAMRDNGSPTFVLVGTDAYGSDILSGVVAQMAMDCPPWCHTGSSPFNS